MRRLSGDEGKEVTYSRGKDCGGDIILDDTGKKNGRGAYICKSLECFKRLKRQRHLSVPLVLVYQNRYMRSLKRR